MLPSDFVGSVRDVLLHLYDHARLQTHPLLAVLRDAETSQTARGRLLRQALLDAIEGLRPGPGTAASSSAWRPYRILELRYIQGTEVGEVAERVALSRSQYHREHNRALEAVASLLWERWNLAGRWGGAPSVLEAAEREAAELSAGEHAAGIDPLEVLRGAARLLQPLCQQHGTALRIVAPAQLGRIPGDRIALRHALLAVLTHAIGRADGEGIDLRARAGAERVRIEIAGRSVRALRAEELGIPVSRPFVLALHGELTHALPAGAGAWSVELDFPTHARPVLLVVDNNPDFVALVQRYLAADPWEIIGASSIDRALTVIRRRPPDAILLDVVMPGRDGWDLLEELRASVGRPQPPVIVCSVLDEPEVAISLGARSYLQKPVDRVRLLAALAEVARSASPSAR
jgi:CheY-like chemotaxis protein